MFSFKVYVLFTEFRVGKH